MKIYQVQSKYRSYTWYDKPRPTDIIQFSNLKYAKKSMSALKKLHKQYGHEFRILQCEVLKDV